MTKTTPPVAVFLLVFVCSTVFAAEDLTSVRADFLRGDHAAVIAKTQALLNHSEKSSEEELLYLRGISAFKVRNLDLARQSLESLISKYPNGVWSAQASLTLADLQKVQSSSLPKDQEKENFFSVQVGAFETEENALHLKNELERKGFGSSVSQSVADGRPLYRVRVGRFSDRQKAEEEAQRLENQGFPSKIVP